MFYLTVEHSRGGKTVITSDQKWWFKSLWAARIAAQLVGLFTIRYALWHTTVTIMEVKQGVEVIKRDTRMP